MIREDSSTRTIRAIFVSASYQTGFDTRSFIVGGSERKGAGHEPQLEPCQTFAGHLLTRCNVS